MTQAKQIVSKLQQLDFYIRAVKPISYGVQIRLGCGANVNVYDKGTVMVQGRLIESCRDESMEFLKRALPANTKWHVT
jgi:hypothetical protein